MIVNLSPSSIQWEETHNSLKYADRAKSIRIDPKLNIRKNDDITHLPQVVQALQAELTLLKKQLAEAQLQQHQQPQQSQQQQQQLVLSHTSISPRLSPLTSGLLSSGSSFDVNGSAVHNANDSASTPRTSLNKPEHGQNMSGSSENSRFIIGLTDEDCQIFKVVQEWLADKFRRLNDFARVRAETMEQQGKLLSSAATLKPPYYIHDNKKELVESGNNSQKIREEYNQIFEQITNLNNKIEQSKQEMENELALIKIEIAKRCEENPEHLRTVEFVYVKGVEENKQGFGHDHGRIDSIVIYFNNNNNKIKNIYIYIYIYIILHTHVHFIEKEYELCLARLQQNSAREELSVMSRRQEDQMLRIAALEQTNKQQMTLLFNKQQEFEQIKQQAIAKREKQKQDQIAFSPRLTKTPSNHDADAKEELSIQQQAEEKQLSTLRNVPHPPIRAKRPLNPCEYRQWECEDVYCWLSEEDNGKWKDWALVLFQHQISGDMLDELNTQDLVQLGIETLGARKRLLQLIKNLQYRTTASQESPGDRSSNVANTNNPSSSALSRSQQNESQNTHANLQHLQDQIKTDPSLVNDTVFMQRLFVFFPIYYYYYYYYYYYLLLFIIIVIIRYACHCHLAIEMHLLLCYPMDMFEENEKTATAEDDAATLTITDHVSADVIHKILTDDASINEAKDEEEQLEIDEEELKRTRELARQAMVQLKHTVQMSLAGKDLETRLASLENALEDAEYDENKSEEEEEEEEKKEEEEDEEEEDVDIDVDVDVDVDVEENRSQNEDIGEEDTLSLNESEQQFKQKYYSNEFIITKGPRASGSKKLFPNPDDMLLKDWDRERNDQDRDRNEDGDGDINRERGQSTHLAKQQYDYDVFVFFFFFFFLLTK
ncbi:hypothetical protein RFI_25467 [Reticulomyxa filosa]|uniref:SAM domain-containing protein n=1 Tax=Reticulomyxa filosa TaxID=46433 RepID=X6ME51_RETFI|nr:hypothetical protein RFI_25467 [Reticulomyxa filosa]|eukprot:ETO11911.1 hypothetical protein RFI_25467 [Reticulomyxa filosa]